MIITRKGDRIQIEFSAKDLGVEELDSPLTREEMDEAIDLYDRMRHPRTNRDRFLAMTDEDLAQWVANIELLAVATNRRWAFDDWLDWVKRRKTMSDHSNLAKP